MTQQLITLYVGANNKTHRINNAYRQKLISTLQKYLKGFTLINAVGFWDGAKEESVLVKTFVSLEAINLEKLIDDLKTTLNQNLIMVEIDYSPNVSFY